MMKKIEKNITIEKIRDEILSLGNEIEEAEAIGICGSFTRKDFNERSDLDVFVILKDGKYDNNIEMFWWKRIKKALKIFRRDVTVFVYTIKDLKKIINWYVLRIASDGILIYDKGNVKELFKKIIRAARDAGLVEKVRGNYKVWSAPKIKIGENLVVELKE